MKCIRCGQCCLHISCYWAQIQWGLNKTNNECPALSKNDNGTYTCLRMLTDPLMSNEMLGTGCHYPKWRKRNEKVTAKT